jgi:hypothetical protein
VTLVADRTQDPFGVAERAEDLARSGELAGALRLLAIWQLAQRARGVSVVEVRQRFRVSTRTVRRDLRLLRGVADVWTSGRGNLLRVFVHPAAQPSDTRNRDKG